MTNAREVAERGAAEVPEEHRWRGLPAGVGATIDCVAGSLLGRMQ